MAGRHGGDEFSQFLSYVALACMLLALVFRKGYWNIIILALLIVCYYRIFRKIIRNGTRRIKFLAARARFSVLVSEGEISAGPAEGLPDLHLPGCKQKIRIPQRKRKKIVVKCPKMSHGIHKEELKIKIVKDRKGNVL